MSFTDQKPWIVTANSVCPICRGHYRQFSSLARGCSPACRAEIRRQRERVKAAKEERRGRNARLEQLKPLGVLIEAAQRAFNAFIRARDELAGLPCISCGEFAPYGGTGGVWDCGHYRTVGAAPELRFEELNAHRQCKSCNSGVRRTKRRVLLAHDPERAASIRAAYRTELIRRIGLDKVEWLEGPHEPKRYRAEEAREIKARYQKMRRELLVECQA